MVDRINVLINLNLILGFVTLHWMEFRPTMVKDMAAKGTLEHHATVTAEQMARLMQNLISEGETEYTVWALTCE